MRLCAGKDAAYGTATLEPFTASHFASNGAADRPKAERHGFGGAESGQGDSNDAHTSEVISVEVNDKLYRVRVLDLPSSGRTAKKSVPARRSGTKKRATAHGNDVVSPMHGVVVEMKVHVGDTVADHQVVAIVEAMKMMNEIRAHKAGMVKMVHAAGETVTRCYLRRSTS